MTPELKATISADVGPFNRALSGLGKTAKTSFGKIGASLKSAFSFAGPMAAGAALVGLIVSATQTVVKFDQSIANLAAVTGKSTSEIKDLKDEALKLGGATAFTANEVAGLQTELAKLGFREKDIIKLTPAILDLAQATGSDLSGAAALAGSVVQSFGLDAASTGSVVDIMTKSFTASALDIHKFEVGIRQVAPVAKTAGVELSEVTAILGVLANNGVRAESAGVGLRNIMLEAAKRGVPFKQLLEKVSISSDKAATAMDLFGKENAAVGVILSESIGKVDELNTSLIASAGTAEKMANTQLNTLSGRFTLLTSAWDGFILSLDDGDGVISTVLRGAIDGLSWAFNALSGKTDSAEDSLRALNDGLSETEKVTRESNVEIAREVLQLNRLKNSISATLPGSKERKNLIVELNKSYPDYITSIVDENTSLETLNGIYAEINKKLKERIVLRISEERSVALLTTQVNKETQAFELWKKNFAAMGGEMRVHADRLDLIQGRYRDLQKG